MKPLLSLDATTVYVKKAIQFSGTGKVSGLREVNAYSKRHRFLTKKACTICVYSAFLFFLSLTAHPRHDQLIAKVALPSEVLRCLQKTTKLV